MPAPRRLPCQADPELMFPVAEPGTDAYDEQVVRARAVCARCPVRVACREYAVETGAPYGIWGGTTPKERAQLRLQLLVVS